MLPPARYPQTVGPRILVVEDDGLAQMLPSSEYHVETAPDGRVALDRVRTDTCDLLIADLAHETMIHEAKRLRPNLPVVLTVSPASEPSARDAVKWGFAAAYLAKPFRAAHVASVVAKALADARA